MAAIGRTDLKECTVCRGVKPLTEFSRRSDRPCGRLAKCKPCATAATRAWAAANETPERRRKKAREYYKRNPTAVKARAKRYRDARPEAKRASAERIRQWCATNPERAKAANLSLKLRHPERRRFYTANRRARLRAQGGQLSSALAQQLFVAQNGLCVYCDGDLTALGYHLDHIMPVSLGGANEDWNIQMTCPTCNRKKCNKHPDIFRAEVEAKKCAPTVA